MGSDAIANARVSAFAKESAKKKKGSKLAKLKQNKLDVRREQWLSQVKSKGYKVETKNCGALPMSIPKGNEGCKVQGNRKMRARGDEHKELLVTFDGEAVSWMSTSVCRKIGRKSLGKIYSGSRTSCSGSCSSANSEEEIDDGCLDDWEAVADALTADINKQSLDPETPIEPGTLARHDESKSANKKIYNSMTLKSETAGIAHRYQGNSRAWSPDDVSRPRNLPSLSKHHHRHYATQNPDRCISQGPGVLSWQRVVLQQPSTCPICCEDFDVTDLSFLPCPCGFRLCLFCHKRILEVDGRCPGCRKQYDSVNSGGAFDGGPVALQLTHSCSQIVRF